MQAEAAQKRPALGHFLLLGAFVALSDRRYRARKASAAEMSTGTVGAAA